MVYWNNKRGMFYFGSNARYTAGAGAANGPYRFCIFGKFKQVIIDISKIPGYTENTVI